MQMYGRLRNIAPAEKMFWAYATGTIALFFLAEFLLK